MDKEHSHKEHSHKHKGDYFHWRQVILLFLLAMFSTFLYILLPIEDFAWGSSFQIGSGLALYGGIVFVFWISLSRCLIRKKYTEIVAAVFIASVALFMNHVSGTARHGVTIVDHIWIFGLWRYASIVIMGVIIHQMGSSLSWRSMLGGGLANLALVGLTCIAFGTNSQYGFERFYHADALALFAIVAVVSGGAGVLLAHGAARCLKFLFKLIKHLLLPKRKEKSPSSPG